VTKIHRAGRLLPSVPRPILREPHFSPGCRTDPTGGVTKKEAAKVFKAWWGSLPPSDVTIFSDGSERYKDGSRGVGYGYVVYQNRRKIAQGYATICADSHVFDAEAIGAWEGLHHALKDTNLAHQRIWMCIDSTSVIWCLRGNASDSSQWAFHSCQDAMAGRDIKIRWSPGHMGIEGNEEADALANLAANPLSPSYSLEPRALLPTVSGIRSQARALRSAAINSWWYHNQTSLSNRYRRWSLDYSVRAPKELELPRATLHRLMAIRSGHGNFKWYHDKFKHQDASLNCTCGGWKSPDHLVHCKKTREHFNIWPHKPKTPPRNWREGFTYLKTLLASPEGFAEFLSITGFYTAICP
jgi:ribonuclease HI